MRVQPRTRWRQGGPAGVSADAAPVPAAQPEQSAGGAGAAGAVADGELPQTGEGGDVGVDQAEAGDQPRRGRPVFGVLRAENAARRASKALCRAREEYEQQLGQIEVVRKSLVDMEAYGALLWAKVEEAEARVAEARRAVSEVSHALAAANSTELDADAVQSDERSPPMAMVGRILYALGLARDESANEALVGGITSIMEELNGHLASVAGRRQASPSVHREPPPPSAVGARGPSIPFAAGAEGGGGAAAMGGADGGQMSLAMQPAQPPLEEPVVVPAHHGAAPGTPEMAVAELPPPEVEELQRVKARRLDEGDGSVASGLAVDASSTLQGGQQAERATTGASELALATVAVEESDVPMVEVGPGTSRRGVRRDGSAEARSGQAVGERDRSRSAEAVRSGSVAARASAASAEFARR